MKAFLLVLIASASFANAAQTEYSPILRCEKYEGSFVTIVSIERKVSSHVDAKTGAITYKGRDFSLQVTKDYATMKPTNDSGSFSVEGQGVVLSPNGRGGVEKTELSCISYEEM